MESQETKHFSADMCKHGNFKTSCAACAEASHDAKESTTKKFSETYRELPAEQRKDFIQEKCEEVNVKCKAFFQEHEAVLAEALAKIGNAGKKEYIDDKAFFDNLSQVYNGTEYKNFRLPDLLTELFHTTLEKKYDLVYSAPRSNFLPVALAKDAYHWLRKLSDKPHKKPKFFFPSNKAYKSLLGFKHLAELYPSAEVVPKDETQIREDLGLPLSGKLTKDFFYRGAPSLDRPVKPEQAPQAVELIDQATVVIKDFFDKNPSETKANLLIYDETINRGITRQGMADIIEGALTRLGYKEKVKVSVAQTHEDSPPEWARLLTEENGEIHRASFENNAAKHEHDRLVFEFINIYSEIPAMEYIAREIDQEKAEDTHKQS